MAAVKQQQLHQMQIQQQQQQQNITTALPNFNLNKEDMSESKYNYQRKKVSEGGGSS